MDEHLTRGVPISRAEVEWAHQRPSQHRVPVPHVGDEVLYRHNDWEDPTPAEVLEVQPLDDLDDPHLWRVEVGPDGQPVELDGRAIIAQRADPWPRVTLRTRFGVGITREARLRGSAGWLPLDWATRYRPVPAVPEIVLLRGRS
jgi:hypothetical protein